MPSPSTPATDPDVVVIGAGPAGLTAARELVSRGHRPVVLEADDVVGGISRTVERDGWRFDIGGHRFFTKVDRVERFWSDVLPDDEFLTRTRRSRIHYRGRMFDYPLDLANVLNGLGVVESARCAGSYLWARVNGPNDRSNFEGWTAARFGWRLYRSFFKTYTEKVWGVPADEIQADWAAQRIKDLSLWEAVRDVVRPRTGQAQVVSLIDRFRYPKYGPGEMWETCRDQVVAGGGTVHMQRPVQRVRHRDGRAHSVVVSRPDGTSAEVPADAVISSMPLGQLVQSMDPAPPARVLHAAEGLRYRDFLTVALVVPEADAFPDNWIYIHSPEVRVGRIQNFGAWSPYLVRDGSACLGMEYFVNSDDPDDLWGRSDEDLVELATREIEHLDLIRPGGVRRGYVVRMPRAYPMYDNRYKANVGALRQWLADNAPNVVPVGRNGMHRYNNQDHSMLTAMLAVENLVDGAEHDIWTVNVDADYHEEKRLPTLESA